MINNIFQAKYQASQLKEFRGFDNAEKLISTYMKTGFLIYPHQIVAALAALEDPLRKGFIFADEVGLGKGIEAMLVVSQHYYDGKKICIIVPNPLYGMWKDMIENKFGLPLEGEDAITLITYNTAVEKAAELKDKFDFVVFEEAHRLRKFHTGENKTATILHETFKDIRKLLLTATPMLKNVMDLYGLVTFIDETALGDADAFYKHYYKKPENYAELKELLSPYIFRTLRSQVKADVNLPERNILTYAYKLDEKEQELNNKLLQYLSKPQKIAFPEMDNYELTLMLEKTFSSSIYALSKTLAGIVVRLRKMGKQEALDEAKELEELLNLSTSITQTNKSKAFLKALETAMKGLKENDFNKKAIIFTENTETQKYLAKLLSEKANYKVVVYNGATSEEPIEDFRNKANILIATDNAAEGFNFDFCNLVINYDNLWLASAIEQRIGRCHRIGQKSDVMVINFLCTELLADVRFYELAYKRLNMFGGILGATDDVVSNITSGEIETRIKETLSATCNAEQTEKDYNETTQEFADEIENNKNQANLQFFRTFDTEIAKKTQNYVQIIKEKSNELKNRLWNLSKFALKDYANFNEDNRSFNLTKSVFKSGNYTVGSYYIDYDKDTMQSQKFTLHNKIASEMLSKVSLEHNGCSGTIHFEGHDKNLKGLSGKIAMFSVDVSNLTEFGMIHKNMFIGYDKNEKGINEETIKQILELPCSYFQIKQKPEIDKDNITKEKLDNHFKEQHDVTIEKLKEKHLPQKIEEIKASFSGVIESGIKRIRNQTEREKFGLKLEAEKAEKELAKLRKELESGGGNEFAINQKIAESSKKLSSLKDNEFLTKLKLKKQEEEKTKEFLDKFKFYTYTPLEFICDFIVN